MREALYEISVAFVAIWLEGLWYLTAIAIVLITFLAVIAFIVWIWTAVKRSRDRRRKMKNRIY